MNTNTRQTPAALVSTFGQEITPTGERCADARPIFKGSNGHASCVCEDH